VSKGYEEIPTVGVIWTASGQKVNPYNPEHGDRVTIEDVAKSLSCQGRFTGHTKRFYSVAEHCVRASRLLLGRFPKRMSWEGRLRIRLLTLLHDAGETICGDIARPIKQHADFQAYRKAEGTIGDRISSNLSSCVPCRTEAAIVKACDMSMCRIEMDNLMPGDLVEEDRVRWIGMNAREFLALNSGEMNQWIGRGGYMEGLFINGPYEDQEVDPKRAENMFLDEYGILKRGLDAAKREKVSAVHA